MKASDFYDATHLFFRDLLAYWLPGSYLIWLVNKGLGKIPSFGVLDAHRLNPYQLGALVGFAVMGGYMTFPLGHWSVNVIRNIAKNVFRDSKMALIQWFFEEQMEADDLRHVRESPSLSS